MAAPPSSRRVLVDDGSPSIQFEGPWFTSTDSFSYSDVSGPIHGGTQRGINGTGRITYRFTGTEIGSFGTSDSDTLPSGDYNPAWECLIDGLRVPSNPPSEQPQNKRSQCRYTSLPDGPHTIVLNVASSGNPFWFDFFMVQPSITTAPSDYAATNNLAVYYPFQDPAIQYVSGQWSTLESIGMITQQAGSTMFMVFNGTKATGFGRMQSGYPSGSSRGRYSIDNGPAAEFTIEGLLLDGTTRFQQLIFETPDMPMGSHNLSVTYLGASTPLILEYMLVQGGDLVFTGNPPPPSNPAGDNKTAASDNDSPHKVSTAVIVGAVVGGVAFLLLIGLVIFLVRKLKRRRQVTILHGIDGEDEPGVVKILNHTVEATSFMHSMSPAAATNTSLPASPAPSMGTVTTTTATPGISRPYSQGGSSMLSAGGTSSCHPHHSMLSYVSASDEKALLASRHASSSAYAYHTTTTQQVGMSSAGYDPRLRIVESTYAGSMTDSQRGSSNEKARLAQGMGPLAVVNADVMAGHSDPPLGISLIHHQDSGVRLPGPSAATGQQFVDIPPSYTVQ